MPPEVCLSHHRPSGKIAWIRAAICEADAIAATPALEELVAANFSGTAPIHGNCYSDGSGTAQ
eukprot:5490147-Pyramimonas_sp.AAC.1